MRNIKTRTIWISVVISALVAVGLIIGVTQTSGVWTNVVIVLLAITFIYMTIAVQIASTKTFRYRAKAVQYPTKKYTVDKESIDLTLKNKGYKPRNTVYGQSYLKIEDENAYKIVVVRNCEKYFSQPSEPDEKKSPNEKALEKCKRFIGLELFFDIDENALKKLPDFCLQGQNVYYAGYAYQEEEHTLLCPNYVEPSETFAPLLTQIHQDAKIEEI